METKRKRNGGFTLIEILTVVAIIGIIALVAVPSFQGLIEKYRVRSAAREFVGLFNRARGAAVQAPVALGSVPYQLNIDCGTDSFSVTPAPSQSSKSSFSAATDFPGVNIYAVEANLNDSPAGEQFALATRVIERSGSCVQVSGTRNFTVFFESPRGNRYRVQVYGTIGAVKIIPGW